jgi:hypothetical protein
LPVSFSNVVIWERALSDITKQHAMPKWVAEDVLQKYFVERHEKYSYKGQKIISARLNQPFDMYQTSSAS